MMNDGVFQDVWANHLPEWNESLWLAGEIHHGDQFGVLDVEYCGNGEFELRYDGWRFKIYPEYGQIEICSRGTVPETYIRERLGTVFLRYLRGALLLHAGAVSTPQGVWGILAASGVGKSTLTGGFMAYAGAKLVSDDVLTLCAKNDSVSAIPSSTQLAMRHGMFDPCDFVSSVEYSWNKRLLNIQKAHCEGCVRPVCGFILLDSDNGQQVRKVSQLEAVPWILRQQFTISNASTAVHKYQFSAVMNAVRNIPCYAVTIDLADAEKVRQCVDNLVAWICV